MLNDVKQGRRGPRLGSRPGRVAEINTFDAFLEGSRFKVLRVAKVRCKKNRRPPGAGAVISPIAPGAVAAVPEIVPHTAARSPPPA